MKKKLLFPLGILILTFNFSSCESDHHDDEDVKKIEVTGSAEIEVVPNEIHMIFTIKEYMNLSRQKVELEKVKTDFLQLCKSNGIPDSNISIASYSGNDRWDYYWYRRRKTEPEFLRTVSYSIKVSSTDKVDNIVNGLNEQSIDNFYVSTTTHSNMEQLRKEVKTKALLAGKNKAEYLAKSIGEKVGDAILIQEIDNTQLSDYSREVNSKAAVYNQDAPQAESSGGFAPNYQKIKIRYEMKVAFKLN